MNGAVKGRLIQEKWSEEVFIKSGLTQSDSGVLTRSMKQPSAGIRRDANENTLTPCWRSHVPVEAPVGSEDVWWRFLTAGHPKTRR